MVADAALRRAARDVVGDAPAGEDAAPSRRPSWSGSRPRPTSCTAPRTADQVVVDLEDVGDVPELLLRDPERALGRRHARLALLYPEGDLAPCSACRRAPARRRGGSRSCPAGRTSPLGPRPVSAEAVDAREAGRDACASTPRKAPLGGVEQDVEPRDRLDLDRRRRRRSGRRRPCSDGGLRVGRRERRPARSRAGPSSAPAVGPEDDRPRGSRSACAPAGTDRDRPPVTTASAGRLEARAVTRTVRCRPGREHERRRLDGEQPRARRDRGP